MGNLDIQPGMLFIAADGDNVGRKVGRAVIANDFDKLHEISSKIDSAQDLISSWTKEVGGIKISGGGDEFTAAIPKDCVGNVEQLRKDVEYAFGYTLSVGIGKSLSEAGRALLIAKLRGKDQIVEFSEETEREIEAIKKRAKKGAMKSMEEYKLAEAYLNKSEEELAKAEQYWVNFHQKPHKVTNNYAAWHMTKEQLKHHLDNWNTHASFDLSHKTNAKEDALKNHPTAITRKVPAAPIQEHVKQNLGGDKKHILYHGVGRDEAGVHALSGGGRHQVDRYDPFHPDPKVRQLPNKQYDEVHSHYTLNVVPGHVGKNIMQEIHDRLKPGGKAIMSVRRDPSMNKPIKKSEELTKAEIEELTKSDFQDLVKEENSDLEGWKALKRLGAKRSGITRKMHHAYLKHGKNFDHPDQVELSNQHKDLGRQIDEVRQIRASKMKKAENREDSCPYCEQTDGIDSDHCVFCHDIQEDEPCSFCMQNDANEGVDCPLCQESSQEQVSDVDCDYCDADASQETATPGTAEQEDIENREQQAEQIEAMGMNPPIIGKQSPEIPMTPDDAAAIPNGGDAGIDPEDNHSKDALASIAQQIESEGSPAQSEVNSIDAEEMPVGNEIEGNISRPDGYGQNTPGDMGLSGPNGPEENGEDPDLSSILEEGLDGHAEEAQKQKVIQMTSQALQQFKACKDILEAARAQTPQLYQASITMLKAMIEMAALLGLGQSDGLGQNSSELGQEQASLAPQAEQNEWNEVFPAHPDNGGAEQKPGHAPSESFGEDDSTAPQP